MKCRYSQLMLLTLMSKLLSSEWKKKSSSKFFARIFLESRDGTGIAVEENLQFDFGPQILPL